MMRIIPVRVLLLDDDEAVRRKVGGWLRDAACDVIAFADEASALAHVARAPCQIGLVDLHLAETDGVTVLGELRQIAPAMRLVALSAFPDARLVVAALRAGANDLLEKPIQQPALLEAIERQLRASGVYVRSEEEFNRRLGARLRVVRTQAQRTLADVAAGCGLTAAQLSQIELGRSATTTWTLARICGALATPLARLFAEI